MKSIRIILQEEDPYLAMGSLPFTNTGWKKIDPEIRILKLEIGKNIFKIIYKLYK